MSSLWRHVFSLLSSSIFILNLCNAIEQCGDTLVGPHGEFTHPEYPEAYAPNADCRWTMIATEKDKVTMIFDLLDIEKDEEKGCIYDYVSIFFSTKEKPDKFCGRPQSRDPNRALGSEGMGSPVIRFMSDDSVQYAGFKMRFQIQRYDYCGDGPCQHMGACSINEQIIEGYDCLCQRGWIGHDCEIDDDECESSPCQNGGNCTTPEFDMYHCECEPGYTGVNCETEIDECESDPCQNGGECSDELNYYECDCPDGYRGDSCEENIDECESEPCQNGGTCEDGVDGYECNCATGWEGDNCEIDKDECASDPCENGGDCVDDLNEYECRCKDGFEGTHCETDIDECASDPCLNGANCYQPEPAKFLCACAPGYTSTNCGVDIDECDSNPCLNGKQCHDRPNAYECECKKGYDGDRCENDIDECESEPCQNGGSCRNRKAKFECDCEEGYQGELCEDEISHCDSSPCMNGATCNTTLTEYFCKCADGFEGDRCEIDIDDCASDPCINEGTCTDGKNRFDCECPDGYGGVMCEIELDECDSIPCKNDGKCVDSPNKYECICQEGFIGMNCDKEGDPPCLSEPCQNNATCESRDNGLSFSCVCPPGFTGITCGHDSDSSDEDGDNPAKRGNGDNSGPKEEEECHPYSCLNNGVCQQEEGYFTCECKEGFSGKNCETDIDECASQPCLNGGSCMDRENSFWCICPVGIRGDSCEDTTEADWRRNSRLLSALLPSILFLIIIAVLAAAIFLWLRKKRSDNGKVKNIDVKPKKDNYKNQDSLIKENKKNAAKIKNKDNRKSERERREREAIVDYDFSSQAYEPHTQSHFNPSYQAPYKAESELTPSAPLEGQVLNSTVPGVGMVYPTNHPQFPHVHGGYPDYQHDYYDADFYEPYNRNEQIYPHNYKNYPNNKNSFQQDPPYRSNPKKHYKNQEKPGRHKPAKNYVDYRRQNAPSKLEDEFNDSLSELELEDFDERDDYKYRKDHWQDRDNERLNNLPDKHRGSFADINPSDFDDDMGERKRKPKGQRSVTFREPDNFNEAEQNADKHRGNPNKSMESLGRERTSFFPNKTRLHRRNSDDGKGRSRLADKPSNKVRRRHSVERGNLTPVKEEDSSLYRTKPNNPDDKKSRHPPEGDSSNLSGEIPNNESAGATTANYASPFKSIRRNSVRVNEGRGFRREAAFFKD